VDAADPEEGVRKLLAIVQERIPKRFGLDPIRDIQVLCPMNRGGLGARSLNIELQKALNPPGEIRIERFGWTFCPGDKVMQIENDYDKEVYNGDLGVVSRQVKNIARPIRVHRILLGERPDLSAPTTAVPPKPPLALPDKPSIAVLPFQNMSGDPEQEYFADGMVEDIITALSRIKWLFVIARNSSFTYKGQAVDVKVP